MKVSFLDLASAFKVEFSLSELPRDTKARLLKELLYESGLMKVIVGEGEELIGKVETAWAVYREGETS